MKKRGKQPFGKCLKMQQEVKTMIERYGDSIQFFQIFSPELQLFVEREKERAYTGTAPTLACMVAGYGLKTTIVWLCEQIESVNCVSGVRKKLTVEGIRKLASLILSHYPYLKASEVLLFFGRFRCSRYGKFYGEVSPMVITDSLGDFLAERCNETHKILLEETRKRPQADDDDALPRFSLDEWLQLRKDRGDTRPLQGLSFFLPHLDSRDDDRKAREAFRRDNDDFSLDGDDFALDEDEYTYHEPDDDEDFDACYA